ncbi:MAG: FadR family transcriptional regulator [Oscillospiraceae bacterium]|jgi:GntR family transcriptional repressor for pyruvate dehydrogenase complex|nr:FadR family transcriptional regulator [Oscillospiraceae bacterium]
MEPVQRVPIVQQVEKRILQLIEEEIYQPGEKLPAEKDLCQQMSVGRGTVREAFRLLQARGYVEIKPGRGAFVAEHIPDGSKGVVEWLIQNESELQDAIEIRHVLEPLAARRMAEKGSSEDIQYLKVLHDKMMEAVHRQDAAQIAQLDEDFHSAILAGTRNHLLIAINQQIIQGMKMFRSKTFQVPQNILNVVQPHTHIMQTIQDRDGKGAEEAMRAHLNKVQEDLRDNIAQSADEDEKCGCLN